MKGLRAMIVDDAEMNHIVSNNILGKLGIKVIEVAKNGLQAFEKYI